MNGRDGSWRGTDTTQQPCESCAQKGRACHSRARGQPGQSCFECAKARSKCWTGGGTEAGPIVIGEDDDEDEEQQADDERRVRVFSPIEPPIAQRRARRSTRAVAAAPVAASVILSDAQLDTIVARLAPTIEAAMSRVMAAALAQLRGMQEGAGARPEEDEVEDLMDMDEEEEVGPKRKRKPWEGGSEAGPSNLKKKKKE